MSRLTLHRYGEHPDQFSELLVPDGAGSHPVAILLHGGFWRTRYDRTLMGPMALDLAGRGWATYNVEYRRGPGAAHRTLADIRAAVRVLDELDVSLDGDRRVVIGHSAGGHLALASAAFAQASLVISLAGVCALALAAEDGMGSGAVVEFVGVTPAQDPDAYAALDPMAMLPSGTRTLLVHGDRDDRVPLSQSRVYLEAARGAGDACELLELPGVDHMAVIDPRSAAYGAYIAQLPGG